MKNINITKFIAIAAAICFSASARAEISQREQQQAAQRAYEASARQNEEVARQAQQAEQAARSIRNNAVQTGLNVLVNMGK